MHRLAARALTDAGLERHGRSRWTRRSDELVWVAELDRGASWSRWTAMFGAVVRAWSPDADAPHVHHAHVSQEYARYGDVVPPAAAGTRFDDHLSWYTAAFDHTHELLTADDRAEAFAVMAADLVRLFDRVRTREELVAAVEAGEVGGFVHRRLRGL